MRLLIATDTYPPLIGGAHRSAQQLAHQLAARQHQVSVVTSWQPHLPASERDKGVPVYRIRDLYSRLPNPSSNQYQHLPPPFADPEAVWHLRRLIRRVQPELVYAYGWLTYSCAAALGGSAIPLVVAARDYGNICALRTFTRNGRACDGPGVAKCLACSAQHYGVAKGILGAAGVLSGRRLLRRRMHGLHTCSRYVHDVMQLHLVGRRAAAAPSRIPIRVIPNFRDTSGSGVVDQEFLARLPTEPFILFVGALRTVKGIQQLLAAYRQLVAPPPLVLIGMRSPDTPAEWPPNVTVLFNASHATVMAAWDRALFGVAPSLWPEPFGNIVHEAMSCGKAVIGTTPGGMTDMILHGETGFVVPAGDVDQLARAMQILVDEPDVRARMGQAGRERAQRFIPETVVPMIEAFLEEILHRRTAAAAVPSEPPPADLEG